MDHKRNAQGYVHSQCACEKCERSRAHYIAMLEESARKAKCPKRAARARAFHVWLRPEQLSNGLSQRVFRFDSRAADVHEHDLVSACEGHHGNFGGSVRRDAGGAFVTLFTD